MNELEHDTSRSDGFPAWTPSDPKRGWLVRPETVDALRRLDEAETAEGIRGGQGRDADGVAASGAVTFWLIAAGFFALAAWCAVIAW